MSASAAKENPTADLTLTVSLFDTAFPKGPALGTSAHMSWDAFAALFADRREGTKDGDNFVPARFKLEPDGRVRRLKENVVARTAVALDCEMHKETGEVPPSVNSVAAYLRAIGWAAVLYTSHNHTDAAPRYRIVLPLSDEIDPLLPAAEVVADRLHLLGVLDASKIGAASLFYFPSCDPGCGEGHQVVALDGRPINAPWLRERAGALLAAREAEQARLRAAALEAAEKRRKARIEAGFDPDASIIEAVRDRLDLAGELLRHGYKPAGKGRYLFPDSQTGVAGVYVMRGNDGVERAYSHHSADPLSPGNLPSWCLSKAVDTVDVVAILEYGGDLKAALRTLATRFGIDNNHRASAPPPQDDQPPEPPPHPGETEDAAPPPEPPPDERGAPGDGAGEGPRAKSKGRSGDNPDRWGEPLDFLADDTRGPPIIEGHHVPEAIWPFVTDTADRMGVDPAAVALGALVACASVISDAWSVQPKRHDHSWTENARLWGAIVGDPSILKTPIVSACTKPIDTLEVKARAEHAVKIRQWKLDAAAAKADKTALPPQPKMTRYMIEGTTIEALSEVLRDDDEARFHVPCRKVLSRHDEMSEFFGSLDRYKSSGNGGSDRGAYLRLYNGGRYTVDRVARGAFAVPDWSACFLGGIQPGPIQRIAREAAEDGLLQRFIYVVPDAQRQGLDQAPDHAAVARYHALFPALAALQPAAPLADERPRPIVLHGDAHEYREDIDALARALSAMPDTSARLKAALGKWPGLFARLCLTFHMVSIGDHRARGVTAPVLQVIPAETAARVAAYMRDIVLPHLLRAEQVMFATEQAGHAHWIAGYILAKKLGRIASRDIARDYRALSAPEARRELMSVMDSLVSVGWLDPEEPNNPVKPVTNWRVNPAVHVIFAERAAAEAERRARAREQVAEAVERVRQQRRAAGAA
jgi:hypothetical protein